MTTTMSQSTAQTSGWAAKSSGGAAHIGEDLPLAGGILSDIWNRLRKWRLENIRDFWHVTCWLNVRIRRGRHKAAFRTYLRQMSLAIRRNIDQYADLIGRLDEASNGLLSKSSGHPGLSDVPPADEHFGQSRLVLLEQAAGRMVRKFDDILILRGQAFDDFWRLVLGSHVEFNMMLNGLVGELGNFEELVVMLPGTDEITASPHVQKCLDRMFQLNMCNIRLLETARQFHKNLSQPKVGPCKGIFRSGTDLGRLVQHMLLEYMIEADPARVAARREQSIREGMPFTHYRFWRSAENLRQLAGVIYAEGPSRLPMPGRPYVDSRLQDTPLFCSDRKRLEWALKELFNNALADTSTLRITRHSVVAEPLPRHAVPNPRHAIRMTLEMAVKRRLLKKVRFARLTIEDDGVGIPPDVLPKVMLWAFSVRRAQFQEQSEQAHASQNAETQAIMIGGKGIGLPYAAAIIREHGGNIRISSEFDKGTKVVIDLPIPSPFGQ
ncbi:MAG: ATP-binding protein [Planctomycetes bacterium]|nr:ATP-binding protein [Planctomycetota bacterium]